LLYLPDAPDALSAASLRLLYLGVTMLMMGPAYMLAAIFSAYGKAAFQMIKSLSMIALNVFWLLVIYPLLPSLHTLFLYSPVSQGISLLVSVIFERIYTARYLKGVELTI
jgi:Na+-driven multidrug efflux pump